MKLVYTRHALDDIRSLDRVVQKRLAQKLEIFAKDPLVRSKKIHDPALGSYRFRVGDYRIIFDIVGEQIVVLRVGHRREIYR